ncbi:DsbA family oxidoreductase [Algicella marina]|uniref:DsbA family oxidoreductase n=1 Tax=Algicella marina TaxID=2683284 RepID=A0A6P1SZQ5_9RHOB|nr:DsbA family oxidoreductase [Algicella marina]QHQ34696.1 DsbA family oxidoreductase [Algicella marina]
MTVLDIIFDPICPWCYIGKSKLEKALAERPDFAFDIHWRPFQLNPDMPAEGMDRRAYLEAKFGGKEGAVKVYSQIAQAAEAAGLEIDFEKMKRTPNTIDAHRLIKWAKVEDRQGAVVSQLFDRYFRQGQDISDHEVLVAVAKTAGMESEVVARLLTGDADVAETRAEDEQARRMGVTGVPTFIVGGRYAVPGAQDKDVWLRVIDELMAASEQLATASTDKLH